MFEREFLGSKKGGRNISSRYSDVNEYKKTLNLFERVESIALSGHGAQFVFKSHFVATCKCFQLKTVPT